MKEEGWYEEAIIVLLGDHGYQLGESDQYGYAQQLPSRLRLQTLKECAAAQEVQQL